MYGGSVGPMLAVLYLLSTGWLFEKCSSSPSTSGNSLNLCTDITIDIRCRRPSVKDSHDKIRPAFRRKRSRADRCCLLNQQKPSDKLSHMQMSCGPEGGNASRWAPNGAASARRCPPYELRTCQGDEVLFWCNVTRARRYRFTWRSPSGDIMARAPSLLLADVRRTNAGLYTCEAANLGESVVLKREVSLVVQFAPVILVPNELPPSEESLQRTRNARLQCTAEAVPAAKVTWYKDSTLVDSTLYETTSETRNCTTHSYLQLRSSDRSSSFVNFSTNHNILFYGNYTCTAVNDYGQDSRVISFYSFSWELLGGAEEPGRRPFNVTGFIVGMLPPLFISFYIILKLGYRSRYAEERGEDDGYREEPFFISY